MNGILVPASVSTHADPGRRTRRVAKSRCIDDIIGFASSGDENTGNESRQLLSLVDGADAASAPTSKAQFRKSAANIRARRHPLRPLSLVGRPECSMSDHQKSAIVASPRPDDLVKSKNASNQHDGMFQFVTATKLGDFKKEKTMHIVRTQAMSGYLRNHPRKRRNDRKAAVGKKKAGSSLEVAGMDGEIDKASVSITSDLILTAPSASSPRLGHRVNYASLDETVSPIHSLCAAEGNLVWIKSWDQRQSEEARWNFSMLESICTPYGSMSGDGLDPFHVLPQFNDARIDSQTLVRRCNRTLSTVATGQKWMPMVLSASSQVILSLTVYASAFTDMMDGISGDSARSAYIKSKVVQWLNVRLQSPITQTDNATIIMICHLIVGEVWVRDDHTFRIHLAGLEKIVTQRGDLKGLPQTIAEVLTCITLETCIYLEEPAPQAFREYIPLWCNPPAMHDILESPLYYPYQEFARIPLSKKCSPKTLAVLYDMRTLTNLFLFHHQCRERKGEGQVDTSMAARYYSSAIDEIRGRVEMLPSAYDRTQPDIAGDYIYESVRIAALICLRALPHCTPFSSASTTISDTTQSPAIEAYLPALLYEALYLTDASECWDINLAGVYHWVALVGAAASRQTNENINSHDADYRLWVSRCLVTYCSRVRTMLKFSHPAPLIGALRTFGRIQEILSSST